MKRFIRNRIYYMILTIIIIMITVLFIYYRFPELIPKTSNKPTVPLYNIPFYIQRKASTGERSVLGVPLTIYESWHSNMVAEKMRDNIYNLLDTNPEFDYYLYSDEASIKFIETNYEPEVANAFRALIPGAYKSDLWRYCILYKMGGVYMDIKYYSVVPLIDIIRDNPVIFVKDRKGSCTRDIGLYNGFMVSPPGNSLFKYCIDDVVNSCKLKLYKTNSLDITGPCLLGEIVKKHKSKEYIDRLKFNFGSGHPMSPFSIGTMITYKGSDILRIYPEYRNEQRDSSNSTHYRLSWFMKKVYKE